MSWSNAASAAMAQVQQAAGASSAEMGQLLTDMSRMAAAGDGNHFIPFGRYRDHGVAFTVENGEITRVSYGDTD